MKVGDKVRFLSAVGGGTVKGFQGKDIVLIEEEDGFETPALIRECVVVGGKEEPVKQATNVTSYQQPQPVKEKQPEPENYVPVELPGGDRINAYIAYLPEDIKSLGHGNYEAYFINDSNYYFFINYMSCENNAWKSIFNGVIEPNTKLFMHEFVSGDLNSLEHICVQFLAFKKDKPFSLKNAYNVELRIDTVKFYKLHCFRENDFFDDEAIVYPLVINDVPEREMLISSAGLQEAMMQKVRVDAPAKQPARKVVIGNPIEEVDLHINQLLDTTAGMSNTEILNYQLSKFHETIEKFKNKKGQKIVFIHGKGDGVLRNAILAELKKKYSNYPFQDASFKEYGFGATMITIK